MLLAVRSIAVIPVSISSNFSSFVCFSTALGSMSKSIVLDSSGTLPGQLDEELISFHRRLIQKSAILPQHLSVYPLGISFYSCLLVVAGNFGCVERRGMSSALLNRTTLVDLGIVLATGINTFE